LSLGDGATLSSTPMRNESKTISLASEPSEKSRDSAALDLSLPLSDEKGRPSAVIQARAFYYITDPNGCPGRLMTVYGCIVWSARYNAWGELASAYVDIIPQPLRLQGQYFDTETGLYYNQARYFEPRVGSFVSQDPIRLNGGHNLYNYAPNILGWADPLGNTANPANATHITYEGLKDGKPYVGYASKPGLGHSAEDVLKYRYPNVGSFDIAPQPFYVGDGLEGKRIARGMEQRVFEDRGGLLGTSNRQNPVGISNPNRIAYLEAADAHRARNTVSAAENATDAARRVC
jgi:RHS repeat-associated protein